MASIGKRPDPGAAYLVGFKHSDGQFYVGEDLIVQVQ
jgi:hypothetical protein